MVPIEPRLQALFVAFFRLGATAYGGPAMMAYLRQECVGKRQWLTKQDFKEGVALCHTIPGATMMQMTTYMGYRLRRLPGALVAAVGFVPPAFLLMPGLSAVYFAFGDLPLVRGVLAAFLGMLLLVAYHFAREALVDWKTWALMGAAWLALWRKVDLLLIVGVGAVLSVVLF